MPTDEDLLQTHAYILFLEAWKLSNVSSDDLALILMYYFWDAIVDEQCLRTAPALYSLDIDLYRLHWLTFFLFHHTFAFVMKWKRGK